ncbi:carboxypeptidase-like regulatory domain-containing protein [Paraburkholderia sp. BCC1884]|uniref:carboxypeptidase-like regulatory domain-containing protein n=1 Tax=Paraburkholderia sp. BCC1884 TaxID=2562668 RepID=UPI001181D6E3|nr:carboxypeptidase-like regulatory domain-containing protein [Paraburkholderia sp. BCC1884]
MHHALVRTGVAAAVAFALFQLGGCGGGGGGGGDSGSGSSGTSTVTATSVSGTVASGSAVVGAAVTLIDSTGTQATATSDINGAYTISVKGMTAPFLIVATDAAGISPPLVSVLAQLPTGTAPAVANVTTLTTAIAAMLTSSGNPTDLAATATLAKVTLPSVQLATITLDQILANILTQNGMPTSGFNPINAPFTPNHTGADAVIDTVSLIKAANGGLSLVSNAAPRTSVALNTQTGQSVTLAAPPAAANYLEPLASLLTTCAANGTLNTSCTPAIDTAFLENGSSDLAVGHDLQDPALKGAVFGSPKTLAFITRNGKQQALVQLPVTLASGSTVVLYTFAQQLAAPVTLPGGTQLSWDLIGDQSQFAVSINSQIQRRTFLDSRLNDVNRYESGLTISIPTASNPGVYSASVTGPGLAAPVWLMPRNASGSSTLGLSDSTLSSAPVSPATTLSNTSLYRWSWQSLSSTANFTAPASSGYYAAQSVDASTVPIYSTYDVTFYDQNGAQLGQSVVINPGSPLSASAGGSVAWPTLLPDFVTQFLTPTGSLAGAQYAMSVSWSSLVNGQNFAYPVTSVQIQTVGPTVAGMTDLDGFSVGAPNNTTFGQYQTTVSAGVNAEGVQTCTNCPFAPLTSGNSRLVQLTGGQNGISYYDISQYND